MPFQTRKSFVRLLEHNFGYFGWNETREVCDCTIDCQVNNTVEAQKSMKSIVRIVHPKPHELYSGKGGGEKQIIYI